jgi:ketosteroid isomerase-like protein
MPYSDPAAVEAAFYSAFGNLDLEQMTSVWASSDDVRCVHPGGGLLQGNAEVIASWAGIFRGSEAPQISHRLLQVNGDERFAVHLVEEQVNSPSADRHATIIATNVYRCLDGEWRMLLHHASLPLVERSAPRDGGSNALH